jgi:hypothetical protein
MRTLSSFKNIHRGEKIVVCGCGESLNDFVNPENFITIGVNDVGRLFQPNYLLVANYKHQFHGDRFHYVETSQAEFLFTHLWDTDLPHPNVVKFRHGTLNGTDFSNPDVLHYTNTSVYMALCLAVHMGASCIGLIGVDFTDYPFYGEPKRNKWDSQLPTLEEQFRHLGNTLIGRGTKVFNLSRTSRLTAFPKMSLEDFAALSVPPTPHAEEGAPLRIVSYSILPVVGMPALLARCINARTSHSCRCLWGYDGYGNGTSFEGDINWRKSPEKAEAVLKEADVVLVHNGRVDRLHQSLLTSKAIVMVAHNELKFTDQSFVKQGFPGVVVGQYQTVLPEFKGWAVIPNPLPLWEKRFQPGEKTQVLTICYTPSTKHGSFPSDHYLYWHAKGYSATMEILGKVAAKFPLRLEVIRDHHIPHSEALEMKRRAHIVIDECVTGGYHRNSLEGLAAGCVVINGVGLLPGVREVLSYCAFGASTTPFVFASLETLEVVLTSLIEEGTDKLIAKGKRNRQWMEQHWDFGKQWERFWAPVINLRCRRQTAWFG